MTGVLDRLDTVRAGFTPPMKPGDAPDETSTEESKPEEGDEAEDDA